MKSMFVKSLLLVTAFALFACDDNEPRKSTHEKEIDEIDAYLEAQNIQDVIYDQNGMRFTVEVAGKGEVPKSGQKVKVSYVGKLFSTGATFDQGDIYAKLDDINTQKGLKYALPALLAGSKATMYLPSALAYGEDGSSTLGVPGNSIVIYEVTLTDVEKTAAQATQFEADTTAIRAFINNNAITGAIKHESGIWYKVDQQGTGTSPSAYDLTAFDYKLTLLSAPNATVEQNTANSIVFGLIDGLKIGFQLMNQGGKATFYIPSGLAYGLPGRTPSIPANANLIFEITLKTVGE